MSMTAPSPTSVEAANHRVVARLIETGGDGGEPDESARLFHPDYVEHDPLAAVASGGLVGHWRALAARAGGLAGSVDEIVCDNDRVMAMATWRGAKLDGKGALHTAELFRLADGRVAEHWDVVDQDVLASLGVTPTERAQPSRPGVRGQHTPAERANAALVLGAYDEVFTQHQLSAADRYYHQDYRHHNLRTDVVPDGLEAFKAFFADNIAAFPDLATDVDHLVCRGDRVMAFVTWRGTLTGRWSGGGPSGRPLTMRTCDQFRVVDGKVAEHWEVVDYWSLRQAGLPTP